MNILGLAVATTEHHAACLLVDGEIVLAVEEERLNRVKHSGMPTSSVSDRNLISDPTVKMESLLQLRAVKEVLQKAGLALDDVDAVAVNGVPFSMWFEDTSAVREVGRSGRIHYVPHHLAHAASCFRVSGFSDACIAVVDGRGECNTATLFVSDETGDLKEIGGVPVDPAGTSVGGVYDTASRLLGFGPHGQGAVMALAAFGEPHYDLSHILSFSEASGFVANPAELQRLLLPLRRGNKDPILPAHAHVARSVQDALVSAVVQYVESSFAPYNSRNLCLAGGVFLNCPLNSALQKLERWDRVFVQPAAHDGGTALGAALEIGHRLGEPRHTALQQAALGPAYNEFEIEAALKKFPVSYHRVKNGAEHVGEALSRSEIVCLFAGQLEYGPRALGNRSILADPRSMDVKSRLNIMKGRAEWRPFGAILREEDCGRFLVDGEASPFMLFTYPVQEEWRSRAPALVHKDGTTRPQTITKKNALLMEILSSFEERTGIPMIINTSFNRGGEPIVCSPEDAIQSFLGLGADAMLMGPFWVTGDGDETAKSV